MLTQVDKANGHVIQKVTTLKGQILRYQTLPEGVNDAAQRKDYETLEEAWQAIGHKIVAVVQLTTPKLELPQNQPGYRATPKGKGKRAKG